MTIKTTATLGLASAAAVVSATQGAHAQSFEGLYFGLSANSNMGQFPFSPDSENLQLDEDPLAGLFAGYNATGPNGLVFGAEIALQGRIDGGTYNNEGNDPYRFENLIDVKFRVGTATTLGGMDTLIYGFAGVSGGKIFAYEADYAYASPFGTSLGVGVDVMVTEGMSAGLEFIGRSMDGYDYDEVGPFDNQTMSLRAAFHF